MSVYSEPTVLSKGQPLGLCTALFMRCCTWDASSVESQIASVVSLLVSICFGVQVMLAS